MQTETQEQTGKDEIVAVASAQTTQEVIERWSDEQRIERETQPKPADDIWPVGNPGKEDRQQTNPFTANLLAKQIHIRQGRQSADDRPDF